MAIRINNVAYSWSSQEFSVRTENGADLIESRIRAVDWGHQVEVTNAYGSGKLPIDQTVGQYTLNETTITFFKAAWDSLRAAIGAGYIGSEFALTIRASTETLDISRVEIEGRIMGESEASAQGSADPLEIPIVVMPSKLLVNGVEPIV